MRRFSFRRVVMTIHLHAAGGAGGMPTPCARLAPCRACLRGRKLEPTLLVVTRAVLAPLGEEQAQRHRTWTAVPEAHSPGTTDEAPLPRGPVEGNALVMAHPDYYYRVRLSAHSQRDDDPFAVTERIRLRRSSQFPRNRPRRKISNPSREVKFLVT